MIRKAFRLNKFGSIGISIPAEFLKEIGLTLDDYVNIEKMGNCIHVSKIKIE